MILVQPPVFGHWLKRCLGLLACSISSLVAAPLPLSHVELRNSIQPNVQLLIDDSISIDWSIMTSGQWTIGRYLSGINGEFIAGDGIYPTQKNLPECNVKIGLAYIWDNGDNGFRDPCRGYSIFGHPELIEQDWRIVSSDFNQVYYNPQVEYEPWPGYEDADFNNVRSHPDSSQPGYTLVRDLSAETFVYAVWLDGNGFSGTAPTATTATSTPNQVVDLWDNHDFYTVTGSGITRQSVRFTPRAGVACPFSQSYFNCLNGRRTQQPWNNDFGRSIAEERQNIANWYQYYRRRSFALKSIVANLVTEFPRFFYGMDFLNNYNRQAINIAAQDTDLTQHNRLILQTLFEYTQKSAGTPLATALDRQGQYFAGKLDRPSPIQASCQSNYTVAFTDGFWNDQRSYRGLAQGDLDGDGASGPFGNTTLADIATYYFSQDLDSELPNNFRSGRTRCLSVPAPDFQHMSTIGVTFGPFGNLHPDSDNCWPTPSLTTSDIWGGNPLNVDPNTTNNVDMNATIDDLWHAAFNSAGYFASSANPTTLLAELRAIFASINQIDTTGALGTLTGSRLDSNNSFVVSRFDVGQNFGQLTQYPTDPQTGAIASTPGWNVDAEETDRYAGSRAHFFTYNPVNREGVYLSGTRGASRLTSAQLQRLYPQLAPEARIPAAQAWIDSLRNAPLGAFVHSSPTYVGQPSRFKGSQRDEVKAGYDEFQARQRQQLYRNMIYVGSNRGLLHGFDLASGQEVFAYLPDALLSQDLTEPRGYTSKMDGQIVAEDAFFADADEWKTVIVAGFRFGATGYIALDVTDPDQFMRSDGADHVLWEYSNDGSISANNPNLGYSYSQAAIGRLAHGRWVAVFGNGYNSNSGQAAIIILDLETGQMIRQLETGVDASDDPLNADRPNGMAEPALVDRDQDGIVDLIYAGDFFGNLWAFDVTSPDKDQWTSAYGSRPAPEPLFSSNGAPITSRPTVMLSPDKNGLLVIVGTGQNIIPQGTEFPDNQLVGIYDRGSQVREQDLITINIQQGNEGWALSQATATVVDGTTFSGWRIPLTGVANGFSITQQPLIEFGELTVLLTRKSQQICDNSAGSSAVLKLNPFSGTSLQRQIFIDANGDPLGDDSPPDAIVLENTLLTGITLSSTQSNNVTIGQNINGQIVEIYSTAPSHTDGRIRYRRLYE